MTAYDNWLTQGSERPELDQDAFDGAIAEVAEYQDGGDICSTVRAIYEAFPALTYAIREVVFPVEMRPYITALTNLAADIRAKVDDEYKSLITIYEDPRDE